MEQVEAGLATRARRAYELGRARTALRYAPIVAVAALAAMSCGRPAGLSCALGAALFLLTGALCFLGGIGGRAVVAGLLAGCAPLALPLLTRTLGYACLGDRCASLCMPACVVGGIAAGAVVGLLSARWIDTPRDELGFAASALAVAALTGCLGCTLAGAAGVLGMLAGVAAGSAPVLILARVRR